jgi:maleylpyruvate isomerase
MHSPGPDLHPLFEMSDQLIQSVETRLNPESAAGSSLLPGWSRAHVIAHLARNADALSNLVHWAKTGQIRPMYPSPEARESDIEESARQSFDDLVGDLRQTATALRTALESLNEEAWEAIVRPRPAASGPEIKATLIPWLRYREVAIHLVDLDCGTDFGDLPEPFLIRLIEETLPRLSDGIAGRTLISGENRWDIGGGGEEISGTTAGIAAWLTGRSDAHVTSQHPLPDLPKWL